MSFNLKEDHFQYTGEQNMVYQVTSRNSGTHSNKSSFDEIPSQ
jgi:hypothetical protein